MLLEELANAGGIEEALVTLIDALRPLSVDSVVLTCQPTAPDNQYARRLREAGVPLASLPRWLAPTRDRVGQLTAGAATGLMILLWPLTLIALAAVALGRRRGLPASWRNVRWAVQHRLPVRAWCAGPGRRRCGRGRAAHGSTACMCTAMAAGPTRPARCWPRRPPCCRWYTQSMAFRGPACAVKLSYTATCPSPTG
jgi:hypothetical protein